MNDSNNLLDMGSDNGDNGGNDDSVGVGDMEDMVVL